MTTANDDMTWTAPPGQEQAGAPGYEVGTTVHVDPRTLLLDKNIREAEPDDDLIASVKDVGVLEPIVAVLTAGGQLRVRFGERRTLAAITADVQPVPVYITGHDSGQADDEMQRLITQRAENTHRRGLTTTEDAGVVAQLALLGMPAGEISRRTRMARPDVDAALTVAQSEFAAEAAESHPGLSLDQAAALAEFEDEPDTAARLIQAAERGQFEHLLQRIRDDRADRAMRAEAAAKAEASGVTVIDHPGYYDKTVRRLSELTDRDGNYLTPESHASCPGHVAWIEHGWFPAEADSPSAADDEYADDDAEDQPRQVHGYGPVFGCRGWREYGHRDPRSRVQPKAAMSTEEREAARRARKLVIDNNKAWKSARTVRRNWLAGFAKTKTVPKGTGRFLCAALSTDSQVLTGYERHRLAAGWLGVKDARPYGIPDLSPAKSATEARCQVVALVQALAAYEESLKDDGAWRHDGTRNAAGRYLRFLEKCGYTLSDVEQFAISSETA